MTFNERIEQFETKDVSAPDLRRTRSDQVILAELIKVLTPHPGGLRRWSVMRAIRKDRESASREIPQKFEDEIERTFRRFCSGADSSKPRPCLPEDEIFYRPKEKAGEVWALIPADAKASVKAEPEKAD